MRLSKKMFFAVKGLFIESGEKIAKMNSIKILKQQLRELEATQCSITRNLVNAKSCSKTQNKELDELKNKQAEYEEHIKKCFVSNKESLAREIAEQIYKMQPEIKAREKTLVAFNCSLQSLELGRKQMLTKLNAIKQELSLLELDKLVNETVAEIHSAKVDVTKVSFQEVTRSIDEARKANKLESIRLIEEQKIFEQDSQGSFEDKLQEHGILHNPNFTIDEILSSIKEKISVNV